MAIKKIRRTRQPAGVPILERALGVLEFLSQCPSGMTLSEIARSLTIPKNTTVVAAITCRSSRRG